jgi:hypothetical protein
MYKQPSLHELSLALTPRDRLILLDKIQKNLGTKKDQKNETLFHKIDDRDQRLLLLQKEYNKLNFWDKFILWLKKIFSTKTTNELIAQHIMSRSYAKLSSSNFQLLEGEGEILTKKFAQHLIDFYQQSAKGLSIIRFFWDHPSLLEQSITTILNLKIPNSKMHFFDFIPLSEAVKIFSEKESKGSLKAVVLKKLEDYFISIPEEVFKQLEIGFLSLYWLKDLSIFDFGKLFSLFRITLEQLDQEELKSASFQQVLPLIEHLTFCLHTASKLGNTLGTHRELLQCYVYIQQARLESFDQDSTNGPIHISKENLEGVPTETLQEMDSNLEQIPNSLSKLMTQIPFAELLKVGHNDPFYRFIGYKPSPHFKSFYQNSLELKILTELDEKFPDIRNSLIQEYKDILFVNGTQTLQYFIPEIVQIKNPGFPIFAYLEAFTTMYSFIKLIFSPLYAEFLRSTSKLIPERLRDVHNAFIFQTGSLEDVLVQIEKLDELYNPVGQDGRVFFRTRAAAMRDLTQQKTYRSLIIQRDKDLKLIIEKGIETVKALQKAIQEVLNTTIESIKVEISRHVDPRTGRPTKDMLKIINNRLEVFNKVIVLEMIAGEELSNQSILRDNETIS